MKNPTQLSAMDPARLAQQNSQLSGHLSGSVFKRVAESGVVVGAESDSGMAAEAETDREVSYDIAFSLDEMRRVIARGHVRTVFTLECQRCLKPMTEEIDSVFSWAFVVSDEVAAQLPSEYEPVLCADGRANILEALEDELLLAIPAFPLHAPEQCSASELVASLGRKPDEDEKVRPFSDLAELLKKK